MPKPETAIIVHKVFQRPARELGVGDQDRDRQFACAVLVAVHFMLPPLNALVLPRTEIRKRISKLALNPYQERIGDGGARFDLLKKRLLHAIRKCEYQQDRLREQNVRVRRQKMKLRAARSKRRSAALCPKSYSAQDLD
jgi:hypothetical protein